VFGLHLINNGVECSEYTAEEVVSTLLSMQKEDGGWAITGQYGDVDATAMTITALAPYYEDERVKPALNAAVEFLSKKQLAHGDYASYGVSNPESTAQVLTALCALGIDGLEDGHFVKNGNTLLDGILKYRLSDGSFCHAEGGDTNGIATVQAFCGAVAYLRFAEGRGPLYRLDSVYKVLPPDDGTTSPEQTSSAPSAADTTLPSTTQVTAEPIPETEPIPEQTPQGRDVGYKPWVSLVIIAAGAAVCAVLVIAKKRHFKNFIALSLLCAAAVAIVWVTDFRSAEEYYNGEGEQKQNVIGRVTLSIRCDTVAGRAEHIPADGVILPPTELEIEKGDSVYTVLVDAARRYRLQIENDGGERSAYITGIAFLYAFDYGDLSGWVFEVNGEKPSLGAGEYELSDGDSILWRYTLDMN